MRSSTDQLGPGLPPAADASLLAAIFEHSNDVAFVGDRHWRITYVSPSIRSVLGYEPAAIVGSVGWSLFEGGVMDPPLEVCQAALGTPGSRVTVVGRLKATSGDLPWVEVTLRNCLDDPRIRGFVGTMRDVSARRRAEERVHLQARLLDAVGQAVVAVGPSQQIIYWNDAATHIYGWTASEAIGRRAADVVSPADGWGDRIGEITRSMNSGHAWTGEFSVRRRDGTEVPVLVTDTPVYDELGERIATVGVSSDLTERLAMHDRVERDRRSLRNAQHSAGLGSFEFDPETGTRSWSEELCTILGLPPDSLPSVEAVLQRLHPGDVAAYLAYRDESIAGQHRDDPPCTVRIIRPDGTLRWVEVSATFGQNGESIVGGTVLDITERKLAEDELAHRAKHDPLTDLPNRSALAERLERALGEQAATGQSVAVAFLDLDRFKLVNDSVGHTTGDRVLVAVAERLRDASRPTDVVGRFGGEEFIVVRQGCTGAHSLALFAESFRQALELPIEVDGSVFSMTASVGVTGSQPGDTAVGMLQDADTAMYFAKQRGRDRVEVFDDELRRRTQHRLDVATELRMAVARHELRLVYQPIVALASDATVGFEALLRWDHPRLGSVSPADFIPLAEDSGLVVPIGRWVLDEALGELARWRAADPAAHALWMSINLSAKQLEQPGLVGLVAAALAHAAVPAHLVHLEITETALMVHVEQSIRTLTALRELGVRISVDDFGTGYSSLSYLKQLPVCTLKIDQSFVSGLGHDLQDRSIAQAIIALAASLELEVLAEGVETATQAATLVELGCQFAQGYLWSRPVPGPLALARWSDEG